MFSLIYLIVSLSLDDSILKLSENIGFLSNQSKKYKFNLLFICTAVFLFGLVSIRSSNEEWLDNQPYLINFGNKVSFINYNHYYWYHPILYYYYRKIYIARIRSQKPRGWVTSSHWWRVQLYSILLASHLVHPLLCNMSIALIGSRLVLPRGRSGLLLVY